MLFQINMFCPGGRPCRRKEVSGRRSGRFGLAGGCGCGGFGGFRSAFGGFASFALAGVFLVLLLFLRDFPLPFVERIIGLGQVNNTPDLESQCKPARAARQTGRQAASAPMCGRAEKKWPGSAGITLISC